MGLLEIGKVTTTHGIKGEIKILSSLSDKEKEQVFRIGSHLHILGKDYEIKSHRVHKGLDMIVFCEFSNINDVLFLKNKKVYKQEAELEFNQDMILDSKLITFDVLTTDGKVGTIKSIDVMGNQYKVLRLLIEEKEVLIPYHPDFIDKIDIEKNLIIIKLI